MPRAVRRIDVAYALHSNAGWLPELNHLGVVPQRRAVARQTVIRRWVCLLAGNAIRKVRERIQRHHVTFRRNATASKNLTGLTCSRYQHSKQAVIVCGGYTAPLFSDCQADWLYCIWNFNNQTSHDEAPLFVIRLLRD